MILHARLILLRIIGDHIYACVCKKQILCMTMWGQEIKWVVAVLVPVVMILVAVK